MPQILGYVTTGERAAFDAYALSLGLDVTALANLLILRELRAPRLPELAARYDTAGPAGDRTKIVAHTRTPEIKGLFAAHAASAALKPSRAAAILFRAELEERWLGTHVLPVNRFDSL